MKKILIILALIVTPVFAFAGTIQRVSVSDALVQGNNHSYYPSLSSDGRYVAFQSDATNLIAGDTNAAGDVFVYDRTLDTIERVSVADGNVEANSYSFYATISADGRYVAFQSNATNLVVDDTNAAYDIFVYDRTLDTIERVSVGDGNVQANSYSEFPVISANGQYVTFQSAATNLVAGDTNAKVDIFVYDRDTNTIERVSVADGNVQANNGSYFPNLSGDGRYITFMSYATNLVAGDTNAKRDIFVYDRDTNTIERVSVSDALVQGNDDSISATISNDGRYIVFYSEATNLVAGDGNFSEDIFVYDRTLDTIERVSVDNDGIEGNDSSYTGYGGGEYTPASISSDGRYVTFMSYATNFVAGDTNAKTDVFVYDRTLDTIERVSVSDALVQGNNHSDFATISSDGRYVAFESDATNLVDGDTNVKTDVFLYDRNPDGYITITKTVVNDDGGLAVVGDFTFYADDEEIPHDTETAIRPGTYIVTEDGPVGYTAIFGGDCAEDGEVTVVSGESVTCTIENNDDAPAPEQEESSGGGGSSRKKTVTPTPTVPPTPQSNEEAVKSVLEQLILVIQQLIQAFLAQQQN